MLALVNAEGLADAVGVGYFTEQELQAKMAEIRARFNVPDEMESPIKKAVKK